MKNGMLKFRLHLYLVPVLLPNIAKQTKKKKKTFRSILMFMMLSSALKYVI